MEVENTEQVVENKAEEVENNIKEIENVIEPEIKPTTPPVYEAKNKILCDLCGKCYVKASISKHRKLCMSKNAKSEAEVPEGNTKKEISIAVVPVEPPPPPPPKLERQTNKAYSREEALADPARDPANEADEYEQVASKPVPPKPLTRVDKLRMLARNGLP